MSIHKSLKGAQFLGTPENQTGLNRAQQRKEDRIKEEENGLRASILSNERYLTAFWAEHISQAPSFIRRALHYELYKNLAPIIETVQERQKHFLTETLPQFLSQEVPTDHDQAKSTLEEALPYLSISSLNDIISKGCKDLSIVEEILLYMHLWKKRETEINALKIREKRRQALVSATAIAAQKIWAQQRNSGAPTKLPEQEPLTPKPDEFFARSMSEMERLWRSMEPVVREEFMQIVVDLPSHRLSLFRMLGSFQSDRDRFKEMLRERALF